MIINKLLACNDGRWTTPLFWECRCPEDHIHPASDETCYACGVRREDAPEASAVEVLRLCYRFRLPRELVAVVRDIAEVVAPEVAEEAAIPF